MTASVFCIYPLNRRGSGRTQQVHPRYELYSWCILAIYTTKEYMVQFRHEVSGCKLNDTKKT